MENVIENWKEVFKIRPLDAEENAWVITIGNHLATKKQFKSAKAAQEEVEGKSWDLIASMIFACIEAKKLEENENNKHLETDQSN